MASRGRAAQVAIDLPPPFRPVKLREVGEAFLQAQSLAAHEGAGTLVYVGRFDVVEFATVLEPDEPLRLARRAFYVGLNALADALTAQAPPGRPVTFRWPDAIHVDGGLVGGGRLAWSTVSSEDRVPDWIVFGGLLEFNSERLIESFARHLMSNIDAWQSLGFDAIARNYVRRLVPEKGATATIVENGDLLMQWRGRNEPERHSLLAALASPTWLDDGSNRRRR